MCIVKILVYAVNSFSSQVQIYLLHLPPLLKLNNSDIIFLKYNYILTKPLLLDI